MNKLNNCIYLVGLKGIAMTSLAIYLKEKGFSIEGSDVDDVFPTDIVLRKNKIKIKKGFDIKNINKNYDFVITTGAHGGLNNPEVLYAKSMGIPVFTHGEYLGKIMNRKKGIAVSGCHGKTTVCSMIAHLLSYGKKDPSYAIGTSEIFPLGFGGHYGKGEYFIAEADEYVTSPNICNKPRFHWLKPNISLITNIEYDHPDVYKNIDEVYASYLKFISLVDDKGVLILNEDDENIRNIRKLINRKYITYGMSPLSDYRVNEIVTKPNNTQFSVCFKELELDRFSLNVPGKHNVLNAMAACIAVNQAGMDWESIKNNISSYKGCKRRFEKKGSYKGIEIYDDYAHHPTEIRATLSSAREWFPGKRIIVIFQPHTFSRTKALFKEFSKAFINADFVIISDIYSSAREKADKTINSEMLVEKVIANKVQAAYRKSLESVIELLLLKVKENDVIFTMGAGDIFLWSDIILNKFKEKI